MKLRLGTKIAAGFGSVLTLTAVLGVASAWKMQTVARDSQIITEQTVPTVDVTGNLQDSIQRLVLAIRTFNFQPSPATLQTYLDEKKVADDNFTAANALFEAHPNLTDLHAGLLATLEGYNKLTGLCQATITTRANLDASVAALTPAGVAASKTATALDDAQAEVLKTMSSPADNSEIDSDELKNAIHITDMTGSILASVESIRLTNSRAQAPESATADR